MSEWMETEKANEARRRRSAYLGNVRKLWKQIQDLFNREILDPEELESCIRRYNESFRNFSETHEVCIQLEVDEEKKALMIDSYNNQRDMKFQLEIMLNEYMRKQNAKYTPERAMSEVSRASSSRSSVREKKTRRGETTSTSAQGKAGDRSLA